MIQYRHTCCPGVVTSKRLDACPQCGMSDPPSVEVDKEDQVFTFGNFSKDKLYEERPWGSFKILLDEPGIKVKKLIIKPGQRTSLQYHDVRTEHWCVASGCGLFTVGDEEIIAGYGSSFIIPSGLPHRLDNNDPMSEEDEDLIIIETQLGECIENDIVRLEDDYDRMDDEAPVDA